MRNSNNYFFLSAFNRFRSYSPKKTSVNFIFGDLTWPSSSSIISGQATSVQGLQILGPKESRLFDDSAERTKLICMVGYDVVISVISKDVFHYHRFFNDPYHNGLFREKRELIIHFF